MRECVRPLDGTKSVGEEEETEKSLKT